MAHQKFFRHTLDRNWLNFSSDETSIDYWCCSTHSSIRDVCLVRPCRKVLPTYLWESWLWRNLYKKIFEIRSMFQHCLLELFHVLLFLDKFTHSPIFEIWFNAINACCIRIFIPVCKYTGLFAKITNNFGHLWFFNSMNDILISRNNNCLMNKVLEILYTTLTFLTRNCNCITMLTRFQKTSSHVNLVHFLLLRIFEENIQIQH